MTWTGAPRERSPDRLEALVRGLWEFTGYSFVPETGDGTAQYTTDIRGG